MTTINFNSNLGSPFNKIEEIGSDISNEFKKLSTNVTNVIKIVFDENYLNNVKTAYDPSTHTGFGVDYESSLSPYTIKQADNSGKVVFRGLVLRYIPSDEKQVIFVKVLSGVYDPTSGVIFGNHKNRNLQITTPFSQNFSFGSSIREINDLQNVMKITVTYKNDKSYFTTASQTTPYHYDYGSLLSNVVIKYGTNSNLKTGITGANAIISKGRILATIAPITLTDNYISQSYIVSLDNNNLKEDITHSTVGKNYSTEWGAGRYYYIEEDLDDVNDVPCGRFALDNVMWINADSSSNIFVQEVIFQENVCNSESNYTPVLNSNTEDLVQYNYLKSNLINGNEYLSKISGETLAWNKSAKTLITISTNKFERRFGKIYYLGSDSCESGNGGSSLNTQESNLSLSSGFFANIESSYEINSRDYTVGNTAIQNVTESNSWDENTIYYPGDIVTQYKTDFSEPLNKNNPDLFEVVSFLRAKTLGQSISVPSTLTLKPLSNSAKINITNIIGTGTAFLPVGNPDNKTKDNYPYKIGRSFVTGSSDHVIYNESQIKPEFTIENSISRYSPTSFTDGSLFTNKLVGSKIGTCIISKSKYTGNNIFKINISDIRPTDIDGSIPLTKYSYDFILKNLYSFSYYDTSSSPPVSKILYQIVPQSSKYNKLILADYTGKYIEPGDFIHQENGTIARVANTSNVFTQNAVSTLLPIVLQQTLIIERMNQNDSIFDSDNPITKWDSNGILTTQTIAITTNTPYSSVYLENISKNGFVYPLQKGFIFKQIEPGELYTEKTISKSWADGGGSVTLGDDDTGGGVIQSDCYMSYIKNDGEIQTVVCDNTEYINISSASPPVITISKPSDSSTQNFIFYGKYKINTDKYRIKNLENYSETRKLKFSNDKSIYCYLTKSDVFKINQILYTNGGTVTDITDWFILESGETKSSYGFGYIKFNYDYTAEACALWLSLGEPKTKTGLKNHISNISKNIKIIFSYFEHQKNQNIIGPVVKNSYQYGDNSLILNEDINYSIVGESNSDIHKSALIDFRSIYTTPVTSTDTLSSDQDPYDFPGKIKCSFVSFPTSVNVIEGTHYLPRIDSLYLTKQGKFKLTQGIPSIDPKPPSEDLSDSMKLYNLFIPAYTIKASDVKTTTIENKRYTMRDIGRLEKRLQIVEYYTQLSLVENKAANMVVTDSSGLTRSKNGIIVDNFDTYLVAGTSKSDYNCAMDTKESALRPPFMTSRFGFRFKSANDSGDFGETRYDKYISGVDFDFRKNIAGNATGCLPTGLYMLTTSTRDQPFIIQPAASSTISLVPLAIVKSTGVMLLDPSVDDWVDKKYKPALRVDLMQGFDQVLNNITDVFINNNEGVWGTHWGNWTTTSTYWTGNRGGRWYDWAHQERDGANTTLNIEKQDVSLGNRIVDVALAHYIRPQDIYLYVTGLRPNTRVHVFLDDVNIEEHCYVVTRSGTTISLTLFTTNLFIPKTDKDGNIVVLFKLKEGKYRTGDRTFNITDSSTNDKFNPKTTMYAMGVFSSSGLTLTNEETIAVGRKFALDKKILHESREIITCVHDPIAQTFSINKDLYPCGVYISSIDLCFANKGTTNVVIELRPTVNGYPDSNNIHPNGVSVVPSNIVKALSEGETAILPDIKNSERYTRFNFNTPVYLQPGEHSFVVRSESVEYTVYSATIGEDDISDATSKRICFTTPCEDLPSSGNNSNRKILTQPYVGELFRSSNASTWIADGTTDLMFSINLCVFTPEASVKTPKTKSISFMVNTDPGTTEAKGGAFGMFEDSSNNLTYETVNLKSFIQDISGESLAGTIDGTATSVNMTLTSSPNSITYENVSFNTDISLKNSYILTKTNAATNTILLTFESVITDPYVTPVIDIHKSGIILIRNMVDTGEITASGSITGEIIDEEKKPVAEPKQSTITMKKPASVRYITKTIGLAEGFDAVNCRAVLTINKPEGTGVSVFVKTQSIGSSDKFDELPYVELVYTGKPFNSINDEYNEMEFNLPSNIDIFNNFAFKICLYSHYGHIVPKVKDFIGLAIL